MTDTITLPREITDEIAEAICKEARCCGGIAYDMWEAIVAAAPADNGWIKCSDRLPEEGEAVLVCDSNNVIFCAEMYDGEFQPDDFPNVPKQGAKITHWRPLPAPPLGSLDH